MSRDSGQTRVAESSDWIDIVALISMADLGLTISKVKKFIEDDLTNVTLLILNDRLTGFAISGAFIRDEVTLMHILVAADQRRRGLGEKLLNENLGFWKKKGAERCLLELRISNRGAKNFYSKIGFVVNGFRPGYYSKNDSREDAILMSVPL
jgi:ribosomal protein S18 acetylase RimI-like enzyme